MKHVTTYTLSNRQRKELLVRGTVLRIALPAPLEHDVDPDVFARSVLGEIAEYVSNAVEDEIVVSPRILPHKTITDVLGSIVDPKTIGPGKWTICLPVIVVELSARRARHTGQILPQWPAGVRVDGRDVIGG